MLCFISAYSQVVNRDDGRIYSGSNFNFFENIKISTSVLTSADENTIKYEDIEGSPYIDVEFPIGRIYSADFELIKTAFVRYNAYTDNMEISLDENGVDYYLVKKLPDFLYFVINNKTYGAFEYNVNASKTINYFVILSENKKSKSILLKREHVIFKKGKKLESSFLSPTPNRFIRLKDELFIKIDDQIIEIPKKIKDVSNLFLGKNKEMETFIKSKKMKTTNEADLLELVNYYNSLFK